MKCREARPSRPRRSGLGLPNRSCRSFKGKDFAHSASTPLIPPLPNMSKLNITNFPHFSIKLPNKQAPADPHHHTTYKQQSDVSERKFDGPDGLGGRSCSSLEILLIIQDLTPSNGKKAPGAGTTAPLLSLGPSIDGRKGHLTSTGFQTLCAQSAPAPSGFLPHARPRGRLAGSQ